MKTISLQRVFEIYNSPYLQSKSIELTTATAEEKVKIKAQLPFVTYSGVYSYRNNESILSYNSTLLPLDIDKLPTKQHAIDLQFHLSNQQGCVMSIVSPRGYGVKAFFYLGCELEHGRKNEFTGDGMAQIFMHYVDQKGPYANHKDDKIDLIKKNGELKVEMLLDS